jgi:hypothetical protein
VEVKKIGQITRMMMDRSELSQLEGSNWLKSGMINYAIQWESNLLCFLDSNNNPEKLLCSGLKLRSTSGMFM